MGSNPLSHFDLCNALTSIATVNGMAIKEPDVAVHSNLKIFRYIQYSLRVAGFELSNHITC